MLLNLLRTNLISTCLHLETDSDTNRDIDMPHQLAICPGEQQ